ncbi:ABC transporter permease [Coraliomargarita akajimensis]|uniref:Binding-protein-dependent transport systems inner membrane component n=1 Tax=Coraliomargarita akajimensis (strain DSM 45221 / IAM 15411 / JCM 23193 / KCTC 12865 / 04OKA010-24) TaxID=583355 RepID=D5EMG0_CORAD|nr:ABC transporter permease [Coraliomargarita akajimensis]ADE53366.1 binding-protein-dependent transport systems inner membrane component [Coraliomargarita akajimensis DSM 45221]
MAEKTSDAIKYKILRFLDVTGFTVFDPVVRLCFGEEPKKQGEAIFKFMVIPSIFICFCLWLWWTVAPNHKTKSGEVPTPDVVYNSAVINDTFHKRENTKAADFLLEGELRESTLAEVEAQIESNGAVLEELESKLAEQEAAYEAQLNSRISPLQAQLDALKAENKEALATAKAAITAESEKIEAGNGSADTLIAAIRAEGEVKDAGRAKESVIKDQIEVIRSEKYEPLEKARLEVNAVADEQQFLKKRVDILTSSNRSVKVEVAREKLSGSKEGLMAATSAKKAVAEGKKVVRGEDSIERLEGQQYAKAMTVYLQIKRSLFTVFIGFITAAIIAIPVGILCGLSRIAMACLTPIISIFKPVSPVVWLLIFQIVVGAFFPDPESHPFFLFFNSLPIIGGLGINPALIFSACTVAMCAVWPALVNTALGVASIDKDHINVARVLRLNFWERLTKIIIPSAMPLVFAGLRISLGVGWMVLIAAEALSSSDGLGKFVWDEYQNGSSFSFANILYACFVVGAIGFMLDRMMIILQRLVSFDGGNTSL